MTSGPATTTVPDVDTVQVAAGEPDRKQPYAALGLSGDEYARIRDVLRRRPTETELAMYSVMFSEHCSYKSSKLHLQQFAAKAPATDVLLAGMGENAGVVDVGDGLAVTFKVESHNHPSYVEPYQGAATGVGGIVRDILAMGARPVAVLDALRFGDAGAADTKRLLPGVVAGIGGYGNCLGLPNVGGELSFDPSYAGNPLVNVLCVGVLPPGRLQRARATGAGNRVVLLGALTGRDGIGGVSVLASAAFDEASGPARRGGSGKRPNVQVGDPFTEKVLIECCLELYDARLVAGIQDLGGAGLTCATSETAAAGGSGMTIELGRVPLREPSMAPPEVLASESQERMLVIVAPDDLPAVEETCLRWGVLATDIGAVTDSERLVARWHGETVADVPPGSLADDGPVYDRPLARPAVLNARQADDPAGLARPATGDELRAALLRLVASPELCAREWVTEQYDRYVQGNTVLAMPADAGVIRLDEDTGRGIAVTLDGNGRFAALDPYVGAQLALAEAYRNVAVTGAKPVAVTNCLNFGSPEDPEVMWCFAEAARGLADGCAALGTPVTGGNVSFYNQTGAMPIRPTPVIGVLGVLDDVRRRLPLGFTRAGEEVWLLGPSESESDLGGSAWSWVEHRHLGGRPPAVDLDAERRLAELFAALAADGVATGSHDCADGGLAQALAECCLRRGIGASVTLDGDVFAALFAETAGRAIVAVPEGARLAERAAEHDVSAVRLGATGGDTLKVSGQFTVPLAELRSAYEATLPALFG